MVITSRPPPRTSSTLSRPSVNTSRNSISEVQVKEEKTNTNGLHTLYMCTVAPPPSPPQKNYTRPFLWWYWQRIQFSSPSVFRGGPGMLSSTNRASWDLLTITSFSFTAVCIRRTLDWSLECKKGQRCSVKWICANKKLFLYRFKPNTLSNIETYKKGTDKCEKV